MTWFLKRRERDSNPWYRGYPVHRFSKPTPSAARPSLLKTRQPIRFQPRGSIAPPTPPRAPPMESTPPKTVDMITKPQKPPPLLQELFMPRTLTLLFTLLLLLAARPARADGPVSLRVLPSTTPLTPSSSPTLLIELKVTPPYHVQSAQPHDKNLIPTSLTLEKSPGITAGMPRFPIATEIPAPAGIKGPPTLAVYEKTSYLQLPLIIDPDAPLGDRTLTLKIETQACNDQFCLPPETATLKIPITLAEPNTPTTPTDPALLAAANAQKYDTLAAVLPAPSPPAAVPQASDQSIAEQRALIAARPYEPQNKTEDQHSIAALILFGFLGGLILNIMPCVLPVIPLKVLSLVQQAHGDRRVAFLHSLSFSAGVITLFIALAIALKALGFFYGQQFQSPAFLIPMILIVVALALSMLGVWTINPPQALYSLDAAANTQSPSPSPQHSALSTSFVNGLLATLLATPCSAPYLGGLLAWAFVQPIWVTALALAWVGVGMSAPYLLLAAFPHLLNKLPRAGRWTELLKQALGIVMLGVAVYLITLLPNTNLWPWAMLAAVLVGLVCWAWGQIPSLNMSLAKVWSIRTSALALGALLGFSLYTLAARATAPNTTSQWQPFSIAALDEGLAQGRPVVVDWTANWCINCHALEALVLSSQPVQQQFEKSNALLLKADLSSDNPPASDLNAKLGGKSIPTLAIFHPAAPTTPTVLRDSYTKDRVINALKH